MVHRGSALALATLLSSACTGSAPDAGGVGSASPSTAGGSGDGAANSPSVDGEPDNSATPENGQTGSPGAAVCLSDEDCEVDPRQWTQPLGSVELVSARCDFVDPPNDTLPVCHCALHVTPAALDADAGVDPDEDFGSRREPYDFVEYAGHRGLPYRGGCSVFGRTPECTYCASEFPGCQLGDDAGCQAPCVQLANAMNADFQASYSVTQRLARCIDTAYCESVVELDGQCYAQAPFVGSPAFDCSLSDAEIASHYADRSGGSCDAAPPAPCETAADCPSALACNDGQCGPCSESCSYSIDRPEDAVCEGDAYCAPGELCAKGFCLLAERAECRFRAQCGERGECVLSGIDQTGGRGNEQTRSFCLERPECPPLERDANGNAQMLDPMVPGCR